MYVYVFFSLLKCVKEGQKDIRAKWSWYDWLQKNVHVINLDWQIIVSTRERKRWKKSEDSFFFFYLSLNWYSWLFVQWCFSSFIHRGYHNIALHKFYGKCEHTHIHVSFVPPVSNISFFSLSLSSNAVYVTHLLKKNRSLIIWFILPKKEKKKKEPERINYTNEVTNRI